VELSRAEQSLIDFAKEEFGASLNEFLLAGLGEETIVQRWHFTITFTGESETVGIRDIKVITYEPADGSSCLPQRRDPLVFIVLLKLLAQNEQVSKPELLYSLEEVFSLLGWDDIEATRHEIDEAIYRYSLLTYQWEMNRSELGSRDLSFYKENGHAITNSRTIDEDVRPDSGTKRTYNRVSFDEFFIRGLFRRELFGVDWNNVSSVTLA
jgi:hypothetical protein